MMSSADLPDSADSAEHPIARSPAFSSAFKDELRKQFFARDQRDKQSLNELIFSSSSVDNESPLPNLASATEFVAHLGSSKRILCLVGAGLSVSSGISTFRDANGKDRFWRDYQVSVLSTAHQFKEDPVLSWWYHASRRREALEANPNPGHQALADLATRRKDMFVVSQNIDGLLARTALPEEQVVHLHGSIFSLQCSNEICHYKELSNYDDPLVPALTIPSTVDISSPHMPLPHVSELDLPQCPICRKIIRPGVVWFGEEVPKTELLKVDQFLDRGEGSTEAEKKIDLMIVVGTSAMVWPATDFIHRARKNGAKIAVFDVKRPIGKNVLMDGGWYFEGDAVVTLPEMLK
jgi:NAD-dependent deacetylase sirtuin 5